MNLQASLGKALSTELNMLVLGLEKGLGMV